MAVVYPTGLRTPRGANAILKVLQGETPPHAKRCTQGIANSICEGLSKNPCILLPTVASHQRGCEENPSPYREGTAHVFQSMSPVRVYGGMGAAMTAMPQQPMHDVLARGPPTYTCPSGWSIAIWLSKYQPLEQCRS